MQGTSLSQPWQLVYEGDFVKGQRQGTGTCYYSTGEVYTGGWHGNKRTGPGDGQAHLKEGTKDSSTSSSTSSARGGMSHWWLTQATEVVLHYHDVIQAVHSYSQFLASYVRFFTSLGGCSTVINISKAGSWLPHRSQHSTAAQQLTRSLFVQHTATAAVSSLKAICRLLVCWACVHQ